MPSATSSRPEVRSLARADARAPLLDEQEGPEMKGENLARRFEEALLAVDRAAAKAVLAVSPEAPLVERLEHVVVPALDHIGREWEAGRVALSQVYMAGRIAEELVAALAPERAAGAAPRVALALLEDHHQLGKRMVHSVLLAAGHDVADLGRVTVDELVAAVKERRFEVVLISVLMLSSARRVRLVVDQLAALPWRVTVVSSPLRYRLLQYLLPDFYK